MMNSVSFGSIPVAKLMNLKGEKVYTDPSKSADGVVRPEKELLVDSVDFFNIYNDPVLGSVAKSTSADNASFCAINPPDNLTKVQKDTVQSPSIYKIQNGKVIGINSEPKKKRDTKIVGFSMLILLAGAAIGSVIYAKKKT